MRIIALIAALALSACAFSSETPFFGPDDAAFPFAEGERFDWITSSDPPRPVRFERAGHSYQMVDESDARETMRGLVFIAITDTEADDYIVQLEIEGEGEPTTYAFMWRVDGRYHVATSPADVLSRNDKIDPAANAFCEWRAYHECALDRRESVFQIFRAFVYPRYVVAGKLPEETIVLQPRADAGPT